MKARFLAERRRALGYSLWFLGAMAAVVLTREASVLAAAGLSALAVMTFRARHAWTPQGDLGWANALTWVRVLGTALLLVLPLAPLVQAAIAALVFSLDGVDGAIARSQGTSSDFGAALDKECDAFFVLTLCTLLWAQGGIAPWVLIAGLWRYAYGVLVALGPQMRAAPRSNWGRYSYSTGCVALVAALLPQTGMSVLLAAGATVVVSASFFRSLYYSFGRN